MSLPEHNAVPSSQPPLGPSRSTPTAAFSLERLSSAFARLMGAPSVTSPAAEQAPQVTIADDITTHDEALPVTPRMIVEGILFVGDAADSALTSCQIASQIRDLTPDEVETIIQQLNEGYRQDGAACEIVEHAGGYRLQLRQDLAAMRNRFRGRARSARLTPQALEVLSVVAYHQGVTLDELNRIRSAQSYPLLAQLVRRQLVRVERGTTAPKLARYYTTARFNQLLGVQSPADLPRAEEVADA